VTLSDRNPHEVHAELVQRVANLEAAMLLLCADRVADRVGGVGWYHELQEALDRIRPMKEPPPPLSR
jgi:hypothetical protein